MHQEKKEHPKNDRDDVYISINILQTKKTMRFMKRKVLSLLALLMMAVTGAWAEDYDLSSLREDESILLKDGDVLTGTNRNQFTVSIADGATVTFDNVHLVVSRNDCFTIKCAGNATIILVGDNHVENASDYPGIWVGQEGSTLTIKGDGTLTAIGGTGCAGIGGAGTSMIGNINIEGGTITAQGGYGGAGIGSGQGGASAGVITITGGNVTATGGAGAAGIGGGKNSQLYGNNNPGCIDISGNGGTITATAGAGAPYAIGSGDGGQAGTLTINGEVVDYIAGPTTTFTAYPKGTFFVKTHEGNGAYWATFYSDERPYQALEGTKVFAVYAEDNNPDLTITEITDRIINPGEGVVLKKSTEGDIALTPCESLSECDYVNNLQGTHDGMQNDIYPCIYVLGYSEENGVGFYRLSEDGTIGAHKAYLVVYGVEDNTRGFFSLEGNASGIENVQKSSVNVQRVFDLTGRSVSQPTKGLYIVNGKKVIIK